MPLHRRLLALVTALLLQFTLVESGLACIANERAPSTMDEMAGMDMGRGSGTQDRATDLTGDSPATAGQPCGAPESDRNCGDPSSDQACSAMSTCTPPALDVAPSALSAFSSSADGAAATPTIAPPARPSAPDHPPPRA